MNKITEITGKIFNKANTAEIIPAGEKTPSSLYEEAIKNKFSIGGITYCELPFSLIAFDSSYQRNESADMEKIRKLAREWDDNLMDLPLVSEHPEEGLFYGIDCYHRIEAMKINGRDRVLCKIASNMPEADAERSIKEAELFSKQGPCENLTIGQRHKANVKRGIRSNVVLEQCIQGRKLFVDPKLYRNMSEEDKEKYADWRVLSGYASALRIAGYTNGKELLTSVLDIIEAVHWREATGGYKSVLIRSLATILYLHDSSEFCKQAMCKYLAPMEPEEFIAKAYAKYPARKEKERLDMLLEEETSRIMGFGPMYTGGDLRGGIACQRAKQRASITEYNGKESAASSF